MMKWQKRAIQERRNLDGKLTRLNSFMASESFDRLSDPVRSLMQRQAEAMHEYLTILDERIAMFARINPPQSVLAQ